MTTTIIIFHLGVDLMNSVPLRETEISDLPLRVSQSRQNRSENTHGVMVISRNGAKQLFDCLPAIPNGINRDGYWTSPGGVTPHVTLYSAILRDLAKGEASLFIKSERGRFTARAYRGLVFFEQFLFELFEMNL